MDCTCKRGYSGYMCSTITERKCKLTEKRDPEIPDCRISNKAECSLKLNVTPNYYKCNSFNGK